MSTYGAFDKQTPVEAATDQANAWVARFAPLIMNDRVLTAEEVKDLLKRLDQLRAEAPGVRGQLSLYGAQIEPSLATTFDHAVEQLDSVEEDLRKRLGKLAPGDPEGIADLERLQERLAERRARQEIGAPTGLDVGPVLEMRTAPSNLIGAAFMGLFATGWLAFTTFHAIFMIGGMMQAVGLWALFLLLFYSIFFGVGFAMAAGALSMASRESIRLEGTTLTVERRLGFWVRTKTHRVDPSKRARIGTPQFSKKNHGPASVKNDGKAVILLDAEGNEVALAAQASHALRKDICERVNAYLQSQT